MIDREHELPVTPTRPGCLASAGGRCTTCPSPQATPICRSCAGSMSRTWSTPSWALGCCAGSFSAKASTWASATRTLMRCISLEALCPQPGTSQRHPGHKVHPYLLRNLAITRANQVWALDTTYIPMARGFVYLTAVVDAAAAWCSHTRSPRRWNLVMPGR